jgi:uncharacterized membrane protein
MNCIKCGQEISETARFCPACGTPVDGGRSRPEIRRILIAMIGGGVAVLLIVAAAMLYIRRPQPSVVPAVTLQAQPPDGDSARIAPSQITPAQIIGFDWSGLGPEQLQSARAALDEAIAKEEESRTGISKAAHAGGKSAP